MRTADGPANDRLRIGLPLNSKNPIEVAEAIRDDGMKAFSNREREVGLGEIGPEAPPRCLRADDISPKPVFFEPYTRNVYPV